MGTIQGALVDNAAVEPREGPERNLHDAQQMANHSSPRVTKLYDRRTEEASLDEYAKVGDLKMLFPGFYGATTGMVVLFLLWLAST